VLPRLVYLALCRSVELLALLTRGDAAMDLEILVLRHQLIVLQPQTSRPKLEPADRALLAAISRVLPRDRWSCFFVTPERLQRWHRRLVAGRWTYPRRGQGRPPLDDGVQQLIIRLARENPRWGYQRIKGELLRLGVRISATAIGTTLHRHGLDPAPRRATTTWRSFLYQHAAGIVACDLLHRRHHLAQAAVCPVLPRVGYLPGPPGRGDRQPQRGVGHPAGPQPAARIGGVGTPRALPAARPRREVLPQLRRRVPLGGRRHRVDAGTGTERERRRRALDPDSSCRVFGLAAHHRARPVGCQKSGCHAAYSYSWISPPRTSQRRSRPKFGALLASAPADGTGVAWAKLRCGRRWL
jgi:transposase